MAARRNPIPAMSADAVLCRSGGMCERCGMAAHDIHHRKPRGMGGSLDPAIHHPANLVHLCRRCHQWAERNRGAALGHGWLVAQYADPANQAIWRWGQWWAVTETALVEQPTYNEPPF